jgi:hypothetical protein
MKACGQSVWAKCKITGPLRPPSLQTSFKEPHKIQCTWNISAVATNCWPQLGSCMPVPATRGWHYKPFLPVMQTFRLNSEVWLFCHEEDLIFSREVGKTQRHSSMGDLPGPQHRIWALHVLLYCPPVSGMVRYAAMILWYKMKTAIFLPFNEISTWWQCC